MATIKLDMGSSGFHLIEDLTRASLTAKIMFATREELKDIKEMQDLHLFDFRKIFQDRAIQLPLSEKAVSLWFSVGLITPFEKSSFVFRGDKTLVMAKVVRSEGYINIVPVQWEVSSGHWSLPYMIRISSVSPNRGKIDLAGVPIDATVIILTPRKENDEVITSSAHNLLMCYILPALSLLVQKSDVVWKEPAKWEKIDDVPLKVYQRPPPSISIVYLNTERILRPPVNDDGSGLTVAPHDRRSHWRQRGHKLILVKEYKVHGGDPFPRVRVGKLKHPFPVPTNP